MGVVLAVSGYNAVVGRTMSNDCTLSRSQKRCSYNTIGGRCHKDHFCRDKHAFVETDTCLSRQNSSFAATKVSLSREKFCRDKYVFVATKVLSRQI